MIFKKVLSNKHFQEVALSSPPIANPMKRITWDTYYSEGQHRPFPQFPTPQTTYLERNYSKILCLK